MKVRVNKDRCFGCGACTAICSDTFVMDDDGLAKVVDEVDAEGYHVVESNQDDVVSASESCPGEAIEIEE